MSAPFLRLVVPQPRPHQHFTGLILASIRNACRAVSAEVVVMNRQQNGAHGIHQALVKLDGDVTDYRLILAPADAPICIGERPIDQHFAYPLSGEANRG